MSRRGAVSLPVLEHGDRGPEAAGRGCLEAVDVTVPVYDPRWDGPVMKRQRVVARASVLHRLEPPLADTARRYAALAEGLGAPCREEPGGGPGGDGGAVARCRLARAWRECRWAVGSGAVALARPRHMDRGQPRPVRVLGLVDLVCVHHWSLQGVLTACGHARSRPNVRACRAALEEALTRIAEITG